MGKPAATDRPRLTSLSHSFTLDFVICCPPGNAEPAMARMQSLMTRLGLEVNTAKTHIVRLPEESFDFLGYTIGGFHGKDGPLLYWHTTISQGRKEPAQTDSRANLTSVVS